MKIMHVMAGRGNGGAEIYSTDVMLGLHEAGLDQCVVMRPNAPRTQELSEAGLRVLTDAFIPPLQLLQRRRMVQVLQDERPSIVHCWMRRAVAVMPSTWSETAPLIGWFGDYKDVSHFSHCTHFVGVTPDIVQSLQDGGIPADRTRYIPTFPSIVEMPPIDRASLDTPADATVLLTLSRLDPVKALDTMLYALQELPDVYLWMAGEGPSQTELERLAHSLHLESRVRFLGWRTDRGALLGAADICVLPSRYEPFGTVILEAWERRVPFVACASAGPKAHIQHGINGMITPVDDAAALAQSIRDVMNDPALSSRIVEQGHADYVRNFTRGAVMRQWTAYYDELMQAQEPNRG